MDTSYLSVENVFDGVRLIAQPLKQRLSKKRKDENTTVAKTVTKWLSDPKNKSIILTLLSQLEASGIEIGMSTKLDVASSPLTAYKYYAKAVTELRQLAKTR